VEALVLSAPYTYLSRSTANPCGKEWCIFELEGHPSASRAYTWSSPVEGSTERQYFAVLNIPPITSPVEAVRGTVMRAGRG
jgi:hypothetical protein